MLYLIAQLFMLSNMSQKVTHLLHMNIECFIASVNFTILKWQKQLSLCEETLMIVTHYFFMPTKNVMIYSISFLLKVCFAEKNVNQV